MPEKLTQFWQHIHSQYLHIRGKSRQPTHSLRWLHVSKTIEEDLQQDISLATNVRATCFKRKEEKVSRNILTLPGICIYAKQ